MRKSHFLPGVARLNRQAFVFSQQVPTKINSFFRTIRNIQTLEF